MNKTTRVKIVTPSSVLYDDEALMVTIPGAEGELGILPNHNLLIASLKEGIVQITAASSKANSEENKSLKIIDKSSNLVLKFFIYPGTAEIDNAHINIVTNFASNITDLPSSELSNQIDLWKKMI